MRNLKDSIIYEILFGENDELSFDISDLAPREICNFTDDIVESAHKGSVEVIRDIIEVTDSKTIWNIKIIRN